MGNADTVKLRYLEYGHRKAVVHMAGSIMILMLSMVMTAAGCDGQTDNIEEGKKMYIK